MASLKDKVASIQDAIPAMNDAVDNARSVLDDIAQRISGVGIAASTSSRGTPSLAYGRLNGQWQFLVSCGDDELTPWGSVSRIVKLQAFAKLPELLDLIHAGAAQVVEESERTHRITRMFGSIRGSSSTPE